MNDEARMSNGAAKVAASMHGSVAGESGAEAAALQTLRANPVVAGESKVNLAATTTMIYGNVQ